MVLEVKALTPRIGSEISVDVETLLNGSEARRIREILDERGVVVFHDLDLTNEQQLAIARTLGTPLKEGGGDDGVYKVSLDSGVNQKADYLRGSMFWHVDGSTQEKPYLGTMLRPVKLAESGGQTEFCNTYAAYEDLPEDEKQALEGLRVVHSMERSLWYIYPEPTTEQVAAWQQIPSKSCPLVWTHQSGRKSLLLGATADYVEGMSPEESRKLLVRLREWATQPQYVYRHEWRLGDLVIWSNTGTMHRALPYSVDSGRLMIRTTLAGEEPLH
ncbi:MAG TPA: TauD/TfdA family dioxygenase [Porticoccaceae bacterium]